MSSLGRAETLLRRFEENPKKFFPAGCESALPYALDVLRSLKRAALKLREVEDGVESEAEVEVITIDDDDASDSSMVKVSFGAKLPALPSPANQKEEKHPRIFVFSSEDPSDLLELLGGKVLPPSLDMKCSVEVRPY